MRRHDQLLPGDISTFSGDVIETDHIEEVSGQTLSGSGSTWTDVRRELWIRPSQGAERRFTFTNVAVPARKGHRVTVLIGAGRPVAIINFSAEQYVNFVRPRDFELFGATEAFVFAALLVGGSWSGPAWLAGLGISAVGYGLLKWLMRRRSYREAVACVEAEIQHIIARMQRPSPIGTYPVGTV
jgi:hypothetical protein